MREGTALAVLLSLCLIVADERDDVWTERDDPLSAAQVSYRGHRLVRFAIESQEDKAALDTAVSKFHLDVWNEASAHTDVRTPPSVDLAKVPLRAEVLHPNIQLLADIERVPAGAGFHNKYHSATEIQQFIKALSRKFPKFVSLELLGKSVKGRPIHAVHVHAANHDPNAPIVFVQAGQHAREWIGPASSMAMLDTLAHQASSSGGLRGWQLTLVPLVNPDGYDFSRDRDRMWRKNLDARPAKELNMELVQETTKSCIGVDLNRQWGPSQWAQIFRNGKVVHDTRKPCSETFVGARAMTEPEVVSVSKHLRQHKKRVKAFLDVHSYSQKLLPPGCNGFRIKKAQAQEQMRAGRLIVESMNKAGGHQGYTTGPCPSSMYFCSGTAGDWAYNALDVVHSYSLELRPSESSRNGFVIAPTQISPTGKELLAGVRVLARASGALRGV